MIGTTYPNVDVDLCVRITPKRIQFYATNRIRKFYEMSRKEALSQFIQQIHGRPVVVKLNSGVDYRGVLACLDGYMNIALEQTEEYVNGQLKDKYGDAFIRGNNVLYISTQKRRT
ncbi:hypothetical protein KM043_003919 [Ampulex compressa]|nr:hypothetical protein KM043_003919 [Ampulex compressa]